jgi:hypothetical protein
MVPLTPEQAVSLAASILRGCGLEDVASSAGRESVYLREPGSHLHLRISNHRRTPGTRRRCPEVVHSLVFREAKSERQVRAMAQSALGAYHRLRRSREPGSPETQG